jgi:hypothetical protein
MPLLLLLLLLWSRSLGAIAIVIVFFIILVVWRHHAIVAHVSFVVVFTFKIPLPIVVHVSIMVVVTQVSLLLSLLCSMNKMYFPLFLLCVGAGWWMWNVHWFKLLPSITFVAKLLLIICP